MNEAASYPNWSSVLQHQARLLHQQIAAMQRLVAEAGGGLSVGQRVRGAAAATMSAALERGGMVATPVLGAGSDRQLGFALAGPGAPAGTVTLSWLDAQGSAPIRVARADRASTHGLGVADVYTLACELGSAPRRVAIVGIEGGDFSNGEGLSAPVEQAVSRAAGLVVELASGGRDDFRTCALPV